MTFGEKVQYLRKVKKISQSELAKRSQIPFYTIVALENNRSIVPLITTALKLAIVFEISIETLIKDVDFN